MSRYKKIETGLKRETRLLEEARGRKIRMYARTGEGRLSNKKN